VPAANARTDGERLARVVLAALGMPGAGTEASIPGPAATAVAR